MPNKSISINWEAWPWKCTYDGVIWWYRYSVAGGECLQHRTMYSMTMCGGRQTCSKSAAIMWLPRHYKYLERWYVRYRCLRDRGLSQTRAATTINTHTYNTVSTTHSTYTLHTCTLRQSGFIQALKKKYKQIRTYGIFLKSYKLEQQSVNFDRLTSCIEWPNLETTNSAPFLFFYYTVWLKIKYNSMVVSKRGFDFYNCPPPLHYNTQTPRFGSRDKIF